MKIKAVILMMVLAANLAFLRAAQAQSSDLTSRAEPQKSSTNWTTVSSPGVSALATPASLIQYAPSAGCACPGNKSGSCLHRLLEWATYCPKERIGCCHSCNSCTYKGVVPLYLFFGRTCATGSGLHATFPNPSCCHGCTNCAAGSPAGCK
ncbi:MAG TPA: hypothetical protein VN688_20225 [Gemmataceae bacterium]|nr:hypothetical protein [Gemmataceae bacterium]